MNDRLTLREAAAEYNLVPITLRKAAQQGRLKAEKEGEGRRATWYVTRADLDAYLEQRRTRTKGSRT